MERLERSAKGRSAERPGKLDERVVAELHQQGGVDLPHALVVLDRAAIGLSAAFLQLRGPVNGHPLVEQRIAEFDSRLERCRTQAPSRHVVPLPS